MTRVEESCSFGGFRLFDADMIEGETGGRGDLNCCCYCFFFFGFFFFFFADVSVSDVAEA